MQKAPLLCPILDSHCNEKHCAWWNEDGCYCIINKIGATVFPMPDIKAVYYDDSQKKIVFRTGVIAITENDGTVKLQSGDSTGYYDEDEGTINFLGYHYENGWNPNWDDILKEKKEV